MSIGNIKPLPSQAALRNRLDYDPETGSLTWKPRVEADFPNARAMRVWNAQHVGKPAFNTKRYNGYRQGRMDGLQCFQHRIIWKWMTGEEPHLIDHINGIPDDNRFANLRSVNASENQRNCRLSARNKSGISGVYFGKNRWIARVYDGGRYRHLGTFRTFDEAASARMAATTAAGYTARHGLGLIEREAGE